MNAASPQPQSPQKRPLRRRVLRAVVLVLVGGMMLLGGLTVTVMTPLGQRWIANQGLRMAAAALPAEEGALRTDISGASIGWSPLGLSLDGVSVYLTAPGMAEQKLASLSGMAMLPANRSGLHWETIEVDGLEVTTAGSSWLQAVIASVDTAASGAEDEATPSFSAHHIVLRNLSIEAADSTGSMPMSGTLALDSAHFDTVLWEGGLPQIGTTAGGLRLMAQRPHTSADTTTLTWTGDDAAWHLQFDGAPAFWLPPGDLPIGVPSLVPGQWTAVFQPTNGALQLSGSADWGMIEASANLGADSLTLKTFELDYHSLPSAIDWPLPTAGNARLSGPLHWAWPGPNGPTDAWRDISGTADLTVRGGTGRRPAQQAGLQWNLNTGALSTEGMLNAVEGDGTTAQLTWSLQGAFVPLQVLNTASFSQPATLSGTWSANRTGQGGGTGKAEGQLTLDATPNPNAAATLSWEWSARTSPLRLTEGLELYAGWQSKGEISLDEIGTIGPWWGHFDITQGRFIPLAGFDGRSRQGPPLAMNRLHLSGRGSNERLSLDLDGDFIAGHLEGPTSLSGWWHPMVDALAAGEVLTPTAAQRWKNAVSGDALASADWEANLTVFRDDLLERYSHDQWSIGPGSHIDMTHRNGQVDFTMDLHPLHVGPVRLYDLVISGSGGRTPLVWQATADSLRHTDWGGAEDISLAADIGLASGSEVRASWDGALAANLVVEHHLEPGDRHVVLPSYIALGYGDAAWRMPMEQHAHVAWTGSDLLTLEADGFQLDGDLGKLSVSRSEKTSLDGSAMKIQLDRLPVGPWLSLVGPPLGMELPPGGGLVHGDFDLRLSPLACVGTAQWEDAQLSSFRLGDLCLNGLWDDQPEIQVQQFMDTAEVLMANLDASQTVNLQLKDWPMEQLQPLFSESGVSIEGRANGGLNVDLSAPSPAITGGISVDMPKVAVRATGSAYGLAGTLDFSEGLIGMDRGTVSDQHGETAMLNLSVLHTAFADWNYDIGLDLDAPFQIMDLATDPRALFYGELWATGAANVSGTADFMEIQAEVRSEPGTRFTMPLDGIEGAEIPSGIRFVGGQTEGAPAIPDAPPFQLSMGLDIEVTPEARLAMILDHEAGERVDGRAQGSLSLVSNRSQTLVMEGGLEILEGQYRFSLRDLFSKNIEIARGGRIDWDGDPYEAHLDLLAIAPFTTSPSPLLAGSVVQTSSDFDKTDVEVGMAISGALSNTSLDFSIGFPSYERKAPVMLSQVNAALSTPEETQRQAFALLATGQFIQPDQQDPIMLGATAAATAAAQASDLVSTGVSELLSSLSEEVEIGLRYIPSGLNQSAAGQGTDPALGQRTEDAFVMDLGLNLLNDRLRISGTLGATGVDGFDVDTEDILGAFDVRYKLTADGRWELMGFMKPASQLEEEPRNGVGAIYQVRFDQLSDLFRKRNVAAFRE
ncbi:MAG: translocation/assembly module TamB [Flavobacteriales bacterium]|nr:translocation/assembly module TamB [Flavobacteriales bacterium]